MDSRAELLVVGAACPRDLISRAINAAKTYVLASTKNAASTPTRAITVPMTIEPISPPTPLYGNDRKIVLPKGRLEGCHLDQALTAIEYPLNFKRPGLVKDGEKYKGFVLGLARDYMRGPCMSRQMRAGPALTAILTEYLKQNKPAARCSRFS